MSSGHRWRRTVFRRIGRHSHIEWPACDSTPLYDRTSTAGLEADVRAISQWWFRHDAHESDDEFVCSVPLTHFRFETYGCYAGSTGGTARVPRHCSRLEIEDFRGDALRIEPLHLTPRPLTSE